MEIRFRVYGPPITEGSLTSGIGKNGKVYTFHSDPRLKFWRHDVKLAFIERNMESKEWLKITDGAVALKLVFYMEPGAKGDLDKLVRAVGDALTGACYVDDSQIIKIIAEKKQADTENPRGVDVHIKTID